MFPKFGKFLTPLYFICHAPDALVSLNAGPLSNVIHLKMSHRHTLPTVWDAKIFFYILDAKIFPYNILDAKIDFLKS